MSRSVDTLYRQWLMLSKIPRYPRRISVPDLNSILISEGYSIDIRTIQRDLLKLSTPFPLSSETEGRKNYWFWSEHASIQDLPGMEPVTALAFEMAESYLAPILPQATITLLAPYFARAKEVLHSASSHLKDWPDKIAVIENGPQLIPPHINSEIQNAVYQAVLEEKQLKIIYKPRYAKTTSEYTAHPLGIVTRQGVIYLVCTFWNYQDVRQLALHRFTSATLLNDNAKLLENFELSSYVQKDHQFAYPISSEPIQLKVIFNAKSALHIEETPLTADQVLTPLDEDRILLEGSIFDSQELRWWLRRFGSQIEVLEPLDLRENFINEAKRLQQLYLLAPK